jgi:hypothetical protein
MGGYHRGDDGEGQRVRVVRTFAKLAVLAALHELEVRELWVSHFNGICARAYHTVPCVLEDDSFCPNPPYVCVNECLGGKMNNERGIQRNQHLTKIFRNPNWTKKCVSFMETAVKVKYKKDKFAKTKCQSNDILLQR